MLLHGPADGGDGKEIQINLSLNWLAMAVLGYWLWSSTVGGGASGGSAVPRHEISFQEFRSKLLAKVRCLCAGGAAMAVADCSGRRGPPLRVGNAAALRLRWAA